MGGSPSTGQLFRAAHHQACCWPGTWPPPFLFILQQQRSSVCVAAQGQVEAYLRSTGLCPAEILRHCPAWALELRGWQHTAQQVLATASQVLDTSEGEVLKLLSLSCPTLILRAHALNVPCWAELLVLSWDWGPGMGNLASVTQLRGLESCSWLGYCEGLWRETYCVFF